AGAVVPMAGAPTGEVSRVCIVDSFLEQVHPARVRNLICVKASLGNSIAFNVNDLKLGRIF
ncbi:MAG: hypothetical protein ABF243_08625, partial [Celeribacter marinus]